MKAKQKVSKKQIREIMTPHPAIDQQEAAKQNGVPVSPDDLAVLETLVASMANAEAVYMEAKRRVNLFIDKIGKQAGLSPDEFELNMSARAFVPRQRKVVVGRIEPKAS